MVCLDVVQCHLSNFYPGPRTLVSASKEVILSAGSIGTPHILQLSGIGDPSDLSKLGISLTVNLPSVGKNLSDQPLLSASWFANSTDPSSKFVIFSRFQSLSSDWREILAFLEMPLY